MPEIAEKAGVATSSLYRRWGTSEQILVDALLGESQVALPVRDTGSLREDLRRFCLDLDAYLRTPRGAILMRTIATIAPTDDLQAAKLRFWAERFALAAVMVQRAIERGEVRADIDCRLVIEAAIAPVHLRHMVTGAETASPPLGHLDLLLDGLKESR